MRCAVIVIFSMTWGTVEGLTTVVKYLYSGFDVYRKQQKCCLGSLLSASDYGSVELLLPCNLIESIINVITVNICNKPVTTYHSQVCCIIVYIVNLLDPFAEEKSLKCCCLLYKSVAPV